MGWFRSIAMVVTSVVVATGATVASATNPAGSGSSVERVVLRPSQVGRGYVLKVIPGGRSVQGQVTLDMCGFRFASEDRRTARLQAIYVRPGSKLALSNEVVSYRPGGAEAAVREVAQAIRTCPRQPVPSTVRGVPDLSFRITLLSNAGKRLLPGAIVMRVTVSGTVNGTKRTETSFVVYQRSGDILSGIYVYGGSLNSRRELAFAASAESARNLKQHP
jgi:hypothetical protein